MILFNLPGASRYIAIMIFVFVGILQANAQVSCVCTNCPLPIPEGFSGDALLEVQGSTNPTLASNGQGVCGVQMEFEHQFLGDLEMTLTSPAGQIITLIGNNDFWGETDFTTWDVTFLPCGITPMPDMGFSDQWDNNQPWGLFGNYDGTYHPYNGCLEDFNMGSVNGVWSLHIEDYLPNDTGIIVSWSLIFCDPAGIDCQSCAAQAGTLQQQDITACQGNLALAPVLTPTYAAGVQAPSPTEYGYTYIVSAGGGTILEYDATPDLSAYPPGTYSICGLSYLLADLAQIPAPNGSLTQNQLLVSLLSANPPFCGQITPNCVNVTVQPPLPDSTFAQTICAGQTITFFGNTYSATGIHSVNVPQGNCSFNASLQLTVLAPQVVSLSETICGGSCSGIPGFSSACTTGVYTDTLRSVLGCDSLIRELDLIVIHPNLAISPSMPTLGCGVNTTTLAAQVSQTQFGSTLTYQWRTLGGGNILSGQGSNTIQVDQVGTYILDLCETVNGQSCCVSDTVPVVVSQTVLPQPIGIAFTPPICVGDTVFFNTPDQAGATGYVWITPAGQLTLPSIADTLLRVVMQSPINGQVCVAAINACGNSDTLCIPVQINPSVPEPIISGTASPCADVSTVYQMTNLPSGTQAFWTVSGAINSTNLVNVDSIRIVWPSSLVNGRVCASYISTCSDTITTCLDVPNSISVPVLNQMQSDLDTICFGASVDIYVPIQAGVSYHWSIPTGMNIVNGAGTDRIRLISDSIGSFQICGWYANACGNSDTLCRQIVVLNNQPPDAGPDVSSCDTSVLLLGTGMSGVWFILSEPSIGGGFISNPSIANATLQGPQGTYTLIRTSGGGSCTRRDTMQAVLSNLINLTQAQPICLPGDQSFQIPVSWTGGSGPYTVNGITTADTFALVGPFASGTLGTVVVQDQSGCSDTLSASWTCGCMNNPGSFVTNSSVGCVGTPLALPFNNDAMPGAGQAVIFAVGANNLASDPASWIYTIPSIPFDPARYLPNTTYYVFALVTRQLPNGMPDPSDSCAQVSVVHQIQWLSLPVADLIADTSICRPPNGLISLSVSPFSFIYPIAGQVSGPNGFSRAFQFSVPTPIVWNDIPAVSGQYFVSSVQMQISPFCSATSFDTIQIAIQQPQTATVRDSFDVCNAFASGSQVNFSAFVLSGSQMGTWTGPNIGTGTLPIRDFTGAAPGFYTFVYTIAQAAPCPGFSDTTIIEVKDCSCPPINLLVPPTACAGDPAIDLDDLVVSAPAGSWSVSNASPNSPIIAPGNLLSISNADTGTYALVYTLTSPVMGCPPADSVLFSLDSCACSPIALGSFPALCNQEATLIDMSSIVFVAPPGQWSVIGSPAAGPTILGDTLRIQNAMPGVYELLYTLTNPVTGCPSSDTIPITIVGGGPSAGIITDTVTLCFGSTDTIHFQDQLSLADPGGTWRYLGPATDTILQNAAALGYLWPALVPPGFYQYAYVQPASQPCKADSAILSIRILSAPSANAGSDQLLDCLIDSIVLNGNMSMPSANLAYTWINSQTSMTVSEGVTAVVFAEGAYQLFVLDTVTGCNSVDTVEVLSDGSRPTATILDSDVTCFGFEDGWITVGNITGGVGPYSLFLKGVSVGNERVFSGLSAGTYTFEIEDAAGCSSGPLIADVAQPNQIGLELGLDLEILAGDTVVIVPQIANAQWIDSIIWQPIGLDSMPFDLVQRYAPSFSKRIRLTLLDANGCLVSDQMLIDVLQAPSVLVPNVLSINSTLNQSVVPVGAADVELIDIWQIFDRWGNMVHEANAFLPGDATRGWDGIFKGKPAQVGVYVYRLRYTLKNGKTSEMSGDITLLRG